MPKYKVVVEPRLRGTDQVLDKTEHTVEARDAGGARKRAIIARDRYHRNEHLDYYYPPEAFISCTLLIGEM